VEMAGALAELTGNVLSRDFKEFGSEDFRIILCEAADRLLPDLPEDLAREAEIILKAKGVEVRFGSPIADFDGQEVKLKDGSVIPTHSLIWTAGIQAAGITKNLDLALGAGGRIVVEPTLQVPGHPEVFAIGDAAYWEEGGKTIPMVAPAAVQMAETAADNILRLLAGKALRSFHYRNPGTMATIGRNAAVAEVKGLKFRGFSARYGSAGLFRGTDARTRPGGTSDPGKGRLNPAPCHPLKTVSRWPWNRSRRNGCGCTPPAPG
jgi:NADH dehydrogenase